MNIYYFAVAFGHEEDCGLRVSQVTRWATPEEAQRGAESLAREHVGAAAFSASRSPGAGGSGDPTVLSAHGLVDLDAVAVMALAGPPDAGSPSAGLPDAGQPAGARSAHAMAFGAEVTPTGVRYRLWAPSADNVQLRLTGPDLPMNAVGEGWHELVVPGSRAGDLYRFVLPGGAVVADPASRCQPHDVDGPSEVIDPNEYRWNDIGWRGRPWEECVVYELHVGTFTAAGTFRSAIDRLPHLRALGITALELMPVADFPGRWNWGYDGVLPFAPDSTYGRPEDLKALIDAAHAQGLMVLLDVVYNHFGPEGNYLPSYAPLMNERHHTPWGAAINFDADKSVTVRQLFVQNALYWLEEYHLDGLRLDAVHAILDDSPEHILAEISRHVRARFVERSVHLILENDSNTAAWLDPTRRYTAQWNDDLHHGLHTAATGERSGYYADYAGDLDKLGTALAEGFAFQGQVMRYSGKPRGEPSAHLPPVSFVSFIQNHDQIGNRALGERITALASQEAVRAIAAVYLLAPQIPMLFMGEEWGATRPFPYFCDFSAELAQAIRDGRRREFSRFPEFADEKALNRIPDPTAESTFRSAVLDWEEADAPHHRGWLAWYRRVLAVRQAEIVPHLAGIGPHSGRYCRLAEEGLFVQWALGDGSRLTLSANFGNAPIQVARIPPGRPIWTEGRATEHELGPRSVCFRLQAPSVEA